MSINYHYLVTYVTLAIDINVVGVVIFGVGEGITSPAQHTEVDGIR
jgi:hypothetical protein